MKAQKILLSFLGPAKASRLAERDRKDRGDGAHLFFASR